MIGRLVALAGVSSCRGVGPAGVGVSASRSSSRLSAASPSLTAACSSSVSGTLWRLSQHDGAVAEVVRDGNVQNFRRGPTA
jgi:hypothetical protein